jgi:lipopolysaccharide transport system permease protein
MHAINPNLVSKEVARDGVSVIGPKLQRISLWAIYEYRELLLALVLRQLTVRYKQTAVGLGWIVLQPLVMMIILTVIFGKFPGLAPAHVPYPLFILASYIPWQMFARVVGEGTGSLIAEQSLIARVYFPRVIVPLAVVMVGAFDLILLLVLFFVGYVIYVPELISLRLLALPIFFAILVLSVSGIILWTSALNVRFRDFGIIVPFALTVLFFLTPIIYGPEFWPKDLVYILSFNPMLLIVDGFRWALFGIEHSSLISEALSLSTTVLAFITGLYYFQKKADDFVDDLC